MKITMWVRHIRTGMLSELHDLRMGKYNEFYLPSVDHNHEIWIEVTDEHGEVTKLHLKR